MHFTPKERDVLQLLKNYRPYHSAGGGAMPPEDTHMRSASYGPAGMALSGEEFEPRHRKALAKSLGHLERALEHLKNGGPMCNALYLLLLDPYLGDPADPSVVDAWRKNPGKRQDNRADWHDLAIREIAGMLRHVDLYPVYPKLMSGKESAAVEHQNAEVYAVFQRLRVSGMPERAAVSQAAENFDLSAAAVERIVEFRSENRLERCAEPACEREPEVGDLCRMHYQKRRREEKTRVG